MFSSYDRCLFSLVDEGRIMSEDLEVKDISSKLPVIGKCKSASSQRSTMAALFQDLVPDEELLESQTPKSTKRNFIETDSSPIKNNVEPCESPNNSETFSFPTPPKSPAPSVRGRTKSSTPQEKRIKVISDVSNWTALMAIEVGLAKVRSSADKSSSYSIDRPGAIESVLAATLTSVTLKSCIDKTSVLLYSDQKGYS